MKKKSALIALVIIILVISAIKFRGSAKTVRDALEPNSSVPINIIYEEKMGRSSLVFYNRPGHENYLETALLKRGIWGYKTTNYSVAGDIKEVSSKFGLTYYYFPAAEKNTPSVCYGIIGNSDITAVKLKENKRNIENEAKIVNNSDIRLWLIDMSKFQGSGFEIRGISKDGKELVKITTDF